MSIILKGIDLAEMGERRRIVIYDNGHVVVKEEGWDEDRYKHYKTLYDVQAIQIPKGHGRIGDLDGVIKQIDESPTFASKYKGTARLFIDVYSDSNTILEAEENE